ncbi:plastocyanin/azurin family copper-binding protein [Natronorubrum sulfidifaciens]|uniref:Blue (Type 1) copper domain-containing protein n=1 Tax=Natronorubrum sulfidifaciens JCM 14089 TaxID=1230460 RepID=L9W8S3_9EURY|nr:plastocyanin/azurin family copper-binding protein [Natronorubrum sulfidifaciens]ELY45661.1 blue (type 1) copper domain-containing protein [Natronorubrum sulfidifaciens JCM 14089]
MARDNPITRRKALKVTGAAAATALVAGCSDDDNGNGDDGDDTYDIEAGTEIVLYAETAGWIGEEPADIDEVTNPTLVLEEGEDYTIGWNEGDGQTHNIEIRNDDGDVVDDLETEEVSEGGDDQFLDFTASEEMSTYVCDPHETSMIGDLQVE